MNTTKHFIRSDLARVLAAVIGTGLVSPALADNLTLTFIDTNPTTATLPGACSGIAWTNQGVLDNPTGEGSFRMCDPSGASLGGGQPVHKDVVNGGETWFFSSPGSSLTFASVTGTPLNPGAACGAAQTAGTNETMQLGAAFFGPIFNFLAPITGSLAGNAYGVATYILSGPPSVGNKVDFLHFPVTEAQWGGTCFPLGQNGGVGVTFVADISNTVTTGATTTFDFEMWANELIDPSEDPGSAGFSNWTAEWHMSGSGAYTDTTAPILASTNPVNNGTVPANQGNFAATFNEPMNPATVTAGFVTIAGETVGAPVTSDNVTFTFPITSLPLNCNPCAVSFNAAGVTDAGGNALTAPAGIAFNVSGADTIKPTLDSVNPVNPPNGAINIATGTSVVVNFSEPMNVASVQTAFSLTRQGGGAVPGSLAASNGNATFTFSPTGGLVDGSIYDVAVTTAAQDVATNALAMPFASSFTTAGATGSVPFPTVNDEEPKLFAGLGSFDPFMLSALAGLAWLGRRGRKRH